MSLGPDVSTFRLGLFDTMAETSRALARLRLAHFSAHRIDRIGCLRELAEAASEVR